MDGQDRVKFMIESGFNATKAHIDQIRNEIEVKRLELLTERQTIDGDKAELDFRTDRFLAEKKEFD